MVSTIKYHTNNLSISPAAWLSLPSPDQPDFEIKLVLVEKEVYN